MTAETLKEIPFGVIRLLVEVLPKYYSYNDMNMLFSHISKITLYLNEEIESSLNEYDSINYQKNLLWQWFKDVNKQDKPSPLEVLNELLNDFWHIEEIQNYVESDTYQNDKNKIQACLSRFGFSYSEIDNRIIKIKKSEAPSTRALRDHVEQHDLSNLDRLIQQSLDDIEKNPLSAVLHASTTLESALKEYLETRQIPYNKNNDTLSKLWKIFMENNPKIHPEELKNNNDLQEIATGLFKIIHGTSSLRNKKSNAHGKSEEEFQTIKISPRHARLAIHTVHTLSAYILELGEDQKKS